MMIDITKLLQKFPKAVDDSRLLKSILMDVYPDERRDIRILLYFVDCGIVRELKSKKVKYLDTLEINKYLLRIDKYYAIPCEISRDLLMIWLNALDIKYADEIDISIQNGKIPSIINDESETQNNKDIPQNDIEKKELEDIHLETSEIKGLKENSIDTSEIKGHKEDQIYIYENQPVKHSWHKICLVFLIILLVLLGIYSYQSGYIIDFTFMNTDTPAPTEDTQKYGFIVQNALIFLEQEHYLQYTLPEYGKFTVNFDHDMIQIISYEPGQLRIIGEKIGETIISLEDENNDIISICKITIAHQPAIQETTSIPYWKFEKNDVTIHEGEIAELHFSVPDYLEYTYYVIGIDYVQVTLKNNSTMILEGLAPGTAWIYLHRGEDTTDSCIVRIVSP